MKQLLERFRPKQTLPPQCSDLVYPSLWCLAELVKLDHFSIFLVYLPQRGQMLDVLLYPHLFKYSTLLNFDI